MIVTERCYRCQGIGHLILSASTLWPDWIRCPTCEGHCYLYWQEAETVAEALAAPPAPSTPGSEGDGR